MTTIDDIAARHAASTPGEWRKSDYLAVRGQTDTVETFVEGKWHTHVATVFPTQTGWADRDPDGWAAPIIAEDAEFIAHAHQDIPYLLAEITKLTAALADAETRGRRAGLEEAAQWHDEQADFTKYHGLSVAAEQHKNCGIAIRALAQSPEDGKQEKV